jgi:hypothetical protein
MGKVWKTKYGLRRVRQDSPTLEEAIFAAKGLTDNPNEQAEIAASLIQLPLDQVKAAVVESAAQRKPTHTVAFTTRGRTQRSVVVERKTTRRPVNKKLSGTRS